MGLWAMRSLAVLFWLGAIGGAAFRLSVKAQPSSSAMMMSEASESPMKSVMEKQFKVGKSIAWGVLQKDVDASSIPDAETQAELRAKATSSLTNIDLTERGRRRLVGIVAATGSAAIYTGMLVFKTTFIFRLLGLYLPISIAAGFLKSADEGL